MSPKKASPLRLLCVGFVLWATSVAAAAAADSDAGVFRAALVSKAYWEQRRTDGIKAMYG